MTIGFPLGYFLFQLFYIIMYFYFQYLCIKYFVDKLCFLCNDNNVKFRKGVSPMGNMSKDANFILFKR